MMKHYVRRHSSSYSKHYSIDDNDAMSDAFPNVGIAYFTAALFLAFFCAAIMHAIATSNSPTKETSKKRQQPRGTEKKTDLWKPDEPDSIAPLMDESATDESRYTTFKEPQQPHCRYRDVKKFGGSFSNLSPVQAKSTMAYCPPSPPVSNNLLKLHHTPESKTIMKMPTTTGSFDSLTRHESQMQLAHDELLGPPTLKTLDNDTTPKKARKGSVDMVVDGTPRANNCRPTLTDIRASQQVSISDNILDESMRFASPPRKNVPYVPSLGLLEDIVPSAVQPPPSVCVHDLPLINCMEEGNVYWKQYVAEENTRLEEQAFPHTNDPASDNIRDSVLRGSNGSNASSIPKDEPRASIDHKRDDLTDDTNASSSLQQMAVDFDEITLIDIIGGGGFGQVWKATWRGTPVAVKVLTGSAQSKSAPRPVLEEFAAEINLLRGMKHPNICLYMGACLEPPNRAIMTELAANGSLWDALRLPLAAPYVPCDGLTRAGWPDELYQTRHGAPPLRSGSGLSMAVPARGTWHWVLVKRVAVGAARGMAYLHSGKPPILHRDLKSANILLGESYTAKLCDFGLSRLKARERSMTGNCGTVQWMAPEVLANQAYNEKVDVYSYGIICWEMLTRQCPYDKMTPIQCALAVLNQDKRPEIPRWCPPQLQVLIRGCVKRDPDERPSFQQVLAALESMP